MEHFIKNIEITNFKSIRHAEIKDCRRVNVFVGPPNVGKSNILEALSGFSLMHDPNPISLSKLLRFTNSSEVFHDGNINQLAKINLNNYFNLSYSINSIKSLNVGIDTKLGKLSSDDYKTYYSSVFTNEQYQLKVRDWSKVNDNKESVSEWLRNVHSLIVKKYSFKGEIDYKPSLDISLLAPYGNNLNDIIEVNQELRKEISSYFKTYRQKLILDKSNSGIRILWFLNDETVFSIPIELVADTLRRLIFYKATILSNENTVLLLEEPEAHCYEPYILEFTNSVKRDENNNQFFIVTHSQYVIEEFLKDEDSRSDTNIYLVGLENNETKVKLLSQEMNKEIYQTGLNVFFNYQSLWNEISEHEAVH